MRRCSNAPSKTQSHCIHPPRYARQKSRKPLFSEIHIDQWRRSKAQSTYHCLSQGGDVEGDEAHDHRDW
ncbi:hypothetical protein B840_12555 (plasmid) [Corynebacterium marinum DSM 44953]|uniref:Uncharacterized protein n=1 Tax=Corynebacterium marinum DSM 44953 TaxID=1224162 RepID=A0A0B6TUW3_9CORY|nr:hypothetical protein B840_12555 [Corynebacterium marinum DSM 44953]